MVGGLAEKRNLETVLMIAGIYPIRSRTIHDVRPDGSWWWLALFPFFVGLLCIVPLQVRASELGAFNDAFADAYGHYRQAVFYGRSGNVAVAALELEQFATKWSVVAARFGENPPDAFADDHKWLETLNAIGIAAQQGLEYLDAGDAGAAREALEPIRDIAGDLRHRNGVSTHSDDVDELSAAMDILARYRRSIESLADPEDVTKVTEQAAIVAYLFQKCDLRAPESVRNDPEFRRLIEGANESLAKLWTSLKTGDMRLYRIGIGEVRSYERILFLRFG